MSKKNILIISFLLLLGLPLIVLAKTIKVDLSSGAIIQGQLLVEKTDSLIIDIGYDVISIPLDKVKNTSYKNTLNSPDKTILKAKGLYFESAEKKEHSVEKNVLRRAESVVKIHTPIGLGSGFIIRDDGYVVTNFHVIEGEHKITITLFKTEAQGLRKILFTNVRIVATDPYSDLALLKIEDKHSHKLIPLPLNQQNLSTQGQTVFSIGSPLGFDRTVGQGIISMPNRQISGHLYIQSTVQTNPGNSGGPLFNLQGEVIGVINMKIASIGIEGLNFAIPVRVLKYFLDNADAYAFDVKNPNTGFRYFQMPTASPK
ncbi:MAG: trypsin-like peptidase domain-containing protein [Pseudomonadota bacterium]